MRTPTLLLFGLTMVVAVAFPASADAYSDRRTYKFGERSQVIYRYEVDTPVILEQAIPSYHCVYFTSQGRCQSVSKEYRNVRTPKVRDRSRYLEVTPTAVSPRAPQRTIIYRRLRDDILEEYVPSSYDTHYRRTHRFDDGVRYDY